MRTWQRRAPRPRRPIPHRLRRAWSGASVASGEPERELERIAKLREDHRDEEADRAFAEFKRRYPEYRIPEAMLARVRPR
jgi:hypothetical protein